MRIGRTSAALGLAVLIVASPLMTGVAQAAPPVLALTTPAAGVSTNTTPVFSGTTDCTQGACSAITVRVYSGSTATGTPIRTLSAPRAASWSVPSGTPFGDGTYTVTASQTRAGGAGGTTTTSGRTFSIDTTGPIVTFDVSNAASIDEGSGATFSYSINDAGVGTLSSVDTSCGAGAFLGGGNTSTAGTIGCHFDDGPTTTTLTATATDTLGNQGNVASWPFTVANVAAIVTFTGGASSVTDGQSSTYSYSIADPGQDAVQSVAPSCGSGTVSAASNTDVDGSFTCWFPTVGATSVSATATDSDGDAGVPGTVGVEVTQSNRAPSAGDIIGTAAPVQGDTTSYSIDVTDPDDDALDYSWSIASGVALFDGPTDAASARLTFPAPGPVTLNVDVSDPAGLSVTRSITIEVAPPPVPQPEPEPEPTLPEPEPTLPDPEPEPTVTDPEPTLPDPEPEPEPSETSPAPAPLPEPLPSPPPTSDTGTGGTPGPGSTTPEPEPSTTAGSEPIVGTDSVAPVAQGGADTGLISPNGDGRMDEMAIDVAFDELTMWTFALRRGNEKLVTITGAGTALHHIWDGSVDGTLLPDGTYQWRVTGRDAAGNELEPLEGEVGIDSTAPKVIAMLVTRRVKMRPLNKPAFRFMVKESARVDVMLVRGGRVITLASRVCPAGKPIAVRWNGRDASGRRLSPGVYRLSVAATDGAWNRTVSDAGSIVVKR